MRALRFYLGLGLATVACTAIDVTFQEEPSGGTGGMAGTGGEGGTGAVPSLGGFGGTVISPGGQGGGAGEAGMAGQGGSTEPPENPCDVLQRGEACDDGDPCTFADACDNARECHGIPKDCDDDNECTADSCNDSGECVSEPVEDGTACGDDTVAQCDAADICLDGACDAQIGPDDAPCDDGDPQTGADICTGLVCQGVPACADGTAEEVFDGNMVGCAGAVTWPERATLCGEGLTPCTAQEWVNRRGEAVPVHNYWTDNQLQYGGNASGNCIALVAGGLDCSDTNAPMRVCGTASDDEYYTTCQWIDCGLQSASPNAYFGGCGIPNPTAGTLCCW